jgi:hypothetical protein
MSKALNILTGLGFGLAAVGLVSQVPRLLNERARPERQSPEQKGAERQQEVQHNLPTKKMPEQDPLEKRESSKRAALWAAGDAQGVPGKR